MPLSLGPFRILGTDKLRTGFRVKYNLLLNKVIKDAKCTEEGLLTFITHDNTEFSVDLTDGFYTKEQIDNLYMVVLATEEEAGIIRIATMEEAFAGEDDNTAITPYKLAMVLSYFNGRAVIAGEDLTVGQLVYTYYPEIEEGEEEPEDGDDEGDANLFPVLTAKLALATSGKTLAMGWVEYDALLGEETFIKFSSTINTYNLDLIPGEYYYLSDAVPGASTLYRPGDAGSWQQTIGYAVDELEMMVELEEGYMNWTPVFVKFPELYYVVKKTSTQEIDLLDYFAEYNLIYTDTEQEDGSIITTISTNFNYEFLNLPDWVSKTTIVFDDMLITGTPPKVGRFVAYLRVKMDDGRFYDQMLVLNVVPLPTHKTTLIDTNAEPPAIIGPIPGTYAPQTKADTKTIIDGIHDEIYLKLSGGGPTGSAVFKEFNQTVDETETSSIRAFLDTDGIAMPQGLYRLEFAIFLRDIELARYVLYFTLGDAAYLAKGKFELWNMITNAKIGDISIQNDSVFKAPDPNSFEPKTVVTGLLHDKATIQYYFEGVLVKKSVYTHGPAVSADNYFVYLSPVFDPAPGIYTIEAIFELAGAVIYQRRNDFEVLKAKPKSEGGVILVEMIPGEARSREIQELPLTLVVIDLPAGGFNAKIVTFGSPVDYIRMEYFRKESNQFVAFDYTRYTRTQNYVTFAEAETDFEVFIFDILSSLDIGDIHAAPSTHRFKFTGRLGGATGEIVGVLQGDVTFRLPLGPADYSGLRFLNVNNSSGVTTLIDPNIPKTGMTYLIPTLPQIWTASFLTYIVAGVAVEFDEFKVQLKKEGVNLHLIAPDAIVHNGTPPKTAFASDDIAYVFGTNTTPRTLKNPANANVIIDAPGLYTFIVTIYRTGVQVGLLQAEFTLILEEDVEEVPEGTCCDISSVQEFNFTNVDTFTAIHNLDRYPDVSIKIGGIIAFAPIVYVDSNRVRIELKRNRSGSLYIK